jgi:hypothetical protein
MVHVTNPYATAEFREYSNKYPFRYRSEVGGLAICLEKLFERNCL